MDNEANEFEDILSMKNLCDEVEMGLSKSYEPIGEWQRRRIKWQAAAHILWLDKDINTEKIKKLLLKSPMYELLDLTTLPSTAKCPNTAEGEEIKFRNLEDAIRAVDPRDVRQGRPSMSKPVAHHPVFISLVYDVALREINMEALHTAIYVMVKILKIQNKTRQEILKHPIINQYKALDSIMASIIDLWIFLAFRNKDDRVVPKPRMIIMSPLIL